MRWTIAAALIVAMSLLSAGCNVIDDQEPEITPAKTQVKLFASVATPGASRNVFFDPNLGDLRYFRATVSNLKFFPNAAHDGLPSPFTEDPIVSDMFHLRPIPPQFPAELVGIVELNEGEYDCVTGVLVVEEFEFAYQINPDLWRRCTAANPVIPFGPVCYPTTGLGPYTLAVEEGVEARPWIDLGVQVSCDTDGGVGTVTLDPSASKMAVETWRQDVK